MFLLQEQNVMVNANNNRIPGQLERHISEGRFETVFSSVFYKKEKFLL